MLKLSPEDKAPKTWKFRHLPLCAKGATLNHCESAFEEREREREAERLFEGIMIDHEQLNPLVRWRSLTLLSRIVSEK